MTTPDPGAAPLQLLRAELLLSLGDLRGDVRLILQRMDQQDQRAEELRIATHALDTRLDALERDAVTRAQLDAREALIHSQVEEQARRRLTIVGLVIAAAAALLSSGITVIGLLIT